MVGVIMSTIKIKGQRMTKQKRAILDILRSTNSHPTANWVYEQVKKEIPDISLGTVYRNLKVLTKTEEIMELNYSSNQCRYDGNPDRHYHFVCKKCEKVLDINVNIYIPVEEIAEQSNCIIEDHRLEYYGICPECK